MTAIETVDLLLQVARAAMRERGRGELRAAEWLALRFFARANRYSRTPSALADFQATTRATVSHVVQRLEDEGLIARLPAPADGRSVTVEVTDKGQAALAQDPLADLARVLATLPPQLQAELRDGLRRTLGELARGGRQRHFDICRDCANLRNPASDLANRFDTGEDPEAMLCSHFDEPVPASARDALCGYFRPTGLASP